jgi:hypothetical protein
MLRAFALTLTVAGFATYAHGDARPLAFAFFAFALAALWLATGLEDE